MEWMKALTKRLLWVDCLGGLFVGVVVMFFCRQLSDWEQLPPSVVLLMGAANLGYGGYSLFVTTRKPRPLALVKILAMANMAWLVVCLIIFSMYRNEISAFGTLHVLGEGVYVAALGYAEWMAKDSLAK